MENIDNKEALLNKLTLLQANEDRYELALNGSQIGWWDWHIGTDNFIVSPFFKSLLGYMEADFPNSKAFFEQKIHPDDRQNVINALQKHVENQAPYDIEFRIMLRSGKYDIFRSRGRTLWDNSGNQIRVVGTVINITEQRKLEKRLSVQYAITHILSESYGMFGLPEITPRILEAICLGLDWEFGAIWVPKEEVLTCVGTWRKPSFPGEEFEEITKKYNFKLNIGLPGRVWGSGEFAYIVDVSVEDNFPRAPYAKKAGLHSAFGFPIMLEYLVVGVIEIFSRETLVLDRPLLNMMTAAGFQIGQFIYQKEIENDLRESEEYKTAIFESVSDSIITIDITGKIDSFNSRTTKMFGYDKTDLANKNIDDLVKDITSNIASIAGKPLAEFVGIHHSGKEFPVELSMAEMLQDKRGRFALTISDITERKKLEKAKKEFVSVVSHELRTPLTSISGSIALLLGHFSAGLSDRAKQMLEIANNNCERLIRIINDILDVEKIEAGKMVFKFAKVNMKKLVEDAVQSNEGYAKKFDVTIRITQAEDIFVNGDYDRLIQVMTNLLSNAIKFSIKYEEVLVALTKDAGWVRVCVTNKGEGIPEKFQSEIFGKFAQADATSTRKAGGTGLGLSICKAIVEHHQGSIGFNSVTGEKVEFYFLLPEDSEDKDEQRQN